MLKSQLLASILLATAGRCVRPITIDRRALLFRAGTNRMRKPYAQSWPTGSKRAGTVMNPRRS